MVRPFAIVLTVACFAVPASACLNDGELRSHEREFRTQYSRQVAPTPKVKDHSARSSLLIGVGAALLGAATAATLRISGQTKG